MRITVTTQPSSYLVPVKGATNWNFYLIQAVWIGGFVPANGITSITNVDKAIKG